MTLVVGCMRGSHTVSAWMEFITIIDNLIISGFMFYYVLFYLIPSFSSLSLIIVLCDPPPILNFYSNIIELGMGNGVDSWERM